MKIGIDARFYGIAGPGRYTKNIIQHLEKVDKSNNYSVFLCGDNFDSYKPRNKNFKKVLADYKWYSFQEQTGFLVSVLKQKLDLFYVPHFNIPIFYPKKIVTAIPDMTMHTYSTEKGTTLPLWYFNIKKIMYRAVFWWAVLRSYKVVVPSKTVMSEFLEHFKGFDKSKYTLAYEGVDPDFIKKVSSHEKVLKKYGIERKFILSVGSMYEHKNVDGLVSMYEVLKEKYGYEGQLVLVSKKDKFSERMLRRVKERGLEDDVLLLAFRVPESKSDIVVTDEEIIALRSQAEVYVMAAFKEGFSLTALEGMAVGLPATLSDIECHREVYADSVVYFDPNNHEEMAFKVNELLINPKLKDEYIKKGYKQVEKYDWMKTAQITLEVFKEAFEN